MKERSAKTVRVRGAMLHDTVLTRCEAAARAVALKDERSVDEVVVARQTPVLNAQTK
jgi:hypothetical protein